jgi:two-component system sensor histidine kinase BaeS
VTSGGRPVATLRLAFPRGSLDPAARHLRATLASALLLSAALASAGALAVAVIAARAIVRPVRRLSEATRALGSGASGVRVLATSGRGELAELGRAFDHMAASLERHERLRQVMVADIAHELRTPVAILQAETEALVDGVREATPESLASLHEESVRLATMVQDLQTLAGADAAGLRLERSWVDLSLVAAEAASSLEARFAERHVHLVQDLSRAVVWGDPNRLRQVVTNLLENARKFTPPGGAARLAVSAGEHYVQLEVSDTGPGIDAEERERVFERFFRGSAGRTAGGTGIGLAVVKQIVEAHGGQVRATSAPHGGALFLVRLPLEQAAEGKELVWPS